MWVPKEENQSKETKIAKNFQLKKMILIFILEEHTVNLKSWPRTTNAKTYSYNKITRL